MLDARKQGLQKRTRLTEAEIAEIVQLNTLCNQQDHLRLLVPVGVLHRRSSEEINDFLYYEQGTLVGYLYMGNWDTKKKEIMGMVEPAFRRRGIFRQLFEAARAECRERNIAVLLLVCEQASNAGQAFARAVGATLAFSEHAMTLRHFIERKTDDPLFQIRPATLADKETIIAIIATDIEEAQAQTLVEMLLQLPKQVLYLATLSDQPLGTIRLDYRNTAIGIYGFVVLPAFQGRGYGRQILESSIRHILAENPLHTITLEVETTNHNALSLYTSCGFQITTTYDCLTYKI